MTLAGLDYLKIQETKRANLAQEDLKLKGYRSNEKIASLDRATREKIAEADRLLTATQKELDRLSNERIAAGKNETSTTTSFISQAGKILDTLVGNITKNMLPIGSTKKDDDSKSDPPSGNGKRGVKNENPVPVPQTNAGDVFVPNPDDAGFFIVAPTQSGTTPHVPDSITGNVPLTENIVIPGAIAGSVALGAGLLAFNAPAPTGGSFKLTNELKG